MRIMDEIARVVQSVFGEQARLAARESGVIVRRRKFSEQSLAQTFILGFLANPESSDEELAGMAAHCGVQVTPQGVSHRVSESLVNFLEAMFRGAIRSIVGSQRIVPELLDRFTAVEVLDSTTISLPDTMAQRFPGCGGSHGSGRAAIKLQVMLNLKSGALDAVAIEAGRDCDYKTSLQSADLPQGALRIADLGYFDTQVLEQLSQHEISWLSRLQYGTRVFTATGEPLRLLPWLAEQAPSWIDVPIQLGKDRRVPCRLLALRVPQDVSDRRRHALRVEAKRKSGRIPSRERLSWCDWVLLVTNVPPEKLSVQEAIVLYRSRWQIELLFRRWKSLGRIGTLDGSNATRQMVQLWARLLAVLIQHWTLLTSVWGHPDFSLTKGARTLRSFAPMLADAITRHSLRKLAALLEWLARTVHATARTNKRKKPSTWELLQDPSRLEWTTS